MKYKTLLICSRVPYPVKDGGCHGIFTLVKALSQNCTLSIATYESSKHIQDVSGLKPFATVSSIPKVNKDYGILDLLRSIYYKKPASILSRFDETLFSKILDGIEEKAFDFIIYAGLQSFTHYDTLKQRYPKSKHILYEANVEYLLYNRISQEIKNPLKAWAYRYQSQLMKDFELNAINKVDGIQFVSTVDELHLKPHLNGLKTISLLPPPLEPPVPRNQSNKNLTICAYADWRWAPNTQGLIWFFKEVWQQIKRALPACQLNITGKHLDDKLVELINSLDGVHYHGFVDDLARMLSKSDLVIAPLPSGSGIKIKLIEAMANGVPFVTTSIGFEGFDAPEISALCVADLPQDFAQKCISLLSDYQLNESTRILINQFAEQNLDPEIYAKKVDTFLSTLKPIS